MSDLIDRQAAIATAVKAAIDWLRLANPQYSIAYCIGEAMRALPTVEPKKGKWIAHETQNDRYDDIKCPFCKKIYTVDAYRIDDIGFTAEDFNFCPNCGADMRGEEE